NHKLQVGRFQKMQGYVGTGGKKPRKVKKPTTRKGVAFSEEIDRSSRQFVDSTPRQPGGSSRLHFPNLPTPNSRHQSNNDYEEEPRHNPVDLQVEELHQYLQRQNLVRLRTLEEKNWQEVYSQMFSAFYECSVKTSTWGDLEKWDYDFKSPCNCVETRNRPVVLIDILTRKQQNIKFCGCQPDPVQLIRMGYIGCSPKFPRTAFSIRLLQFHHILWKNSAVAMLPFATALDEFLDANNPLILVHNNGEDFDSPFSTREWRKTLSSAVDAYREMLQREQALAEEVMEMTSMDKMADLCPKCFGPQVTGKRPSESHYHVCMDANFQQRRHLSASVEIAEHLKTPSLFIEPHVVSEMENSMDSNQTSESAVQEEPKKLAFLYDIGCNIEKGIIRSLTFKIAAKP
ncbi:hypothetical protein MJO29_012357, partial [Puccinia striiformis f. sp. tritici]